MRVSLDEHAKCQLRAALATVTEAVRRVITEWGPPDRRAAAALPRQRATVAAHRHCAAAGGDGSVRPSAGAGGRPPAH
jgi:hypothetical protein